MFDLCRDPNGGIRETMLHHLNTVYTLDDALDLLEMDEVDQSWRAASRRNNDRISDEVAKRNRQGERDA